MFSREWNSDKLQKWQERALRVIFADYSSPFSDLLKCGTFLSFRLKYLETKMHKCVHGLNPQQLNQLFISKHTRYDLRGSSRLQQSEFQTAI